MQAYYREVFEDGPCASQGFKGLYQDLQVRAPVSYTHLAATMEDIKGRALMKRDEVDVVQFALPVAGDNDIQIINNLRDQVQSLKEMWTGRTPAGIPVSYTHLDVYKRQNQDRCRFVSSWF